MSELDVFELLEWVDIFNSCKDTSSKLSIRDRIHSALNKKIVAEISQPLTEAANLFFGSKNSVAWMSVDRVAGMDDYVMVVGQSTPSLGSSVIIDGQPTLITENNVNKHRRTLRMIIPEKLVHSDKVETLANFIKDLSVISSIASDSDMENLLKAYLYNNLDRLTDSPIYHKIMDKATKPTEAFGFNITNLEDEQVKSLFLLGPKFDDIESSKH